MEVSIIPPPRIMILREFLRFALRLDLRLAFLLFFFELDLRLALRLLFFELDLRYIGICYSMGPQKNPAKNEWMELKKQPS